MPDFHSDLLFLLHDVARLLRVDVDRRARVHGMTRAQWVVLAWLQRQPGLSQKELSEILDVEPITVGRVVDKLEARRLVERCPDPNDRRIWRLHLRPEAEPVLAHFAVQRTELLHQLTAGLDEDTRAVTTRALLVMKAALSADRRAGADGGAAERPAVPRSQQADTDPDDAELEAAGPVRADMGA